jgi:hypothetical protein
MNPKPFTFWIPPTRRPHIAPPPFSGEGEEDDPRINAKEREFTLPARAGPDSSCPPHGGLHDAFQRFPARAGPDSSCPFCPSMFPLLPPTYRTHPPNNATLPVGFSRSSSDSHRFQTVERWTPTLFKPASAGLPGPRLQTFPSSCRPSALAEKPSPRTHQTQSVRAAHGPGRPHDVVFGSRFIPRP